MNAEEKVKKMLETVLDSVAWLGLGPIWRLKSKRPFSEDETGKPAFYFDTFEPIPEDDIVKEENPFWRFVHDMAELDRAKVMAETQGAFRGDVDYALRKRMYERGFKIKSQKDLEIVWMYFRHKNWVENNQSGFVRAMINMGCFERPSGCSGNPKNVDMGYVSNALRKAYEKENFEFKALDDFVNLEAFMAKWKQKYGSAAKKPKKYEDWEKTMKLVVETFKDIEVDA